MDKNRPFLAIHAPPRQIEIYLRAMTSLPAVASAGVSRRTNFRTALAKPSFSLLSVTALAWAFTSSLELPMAMEKPLARNMETSFGMSPMVAIWAGAMIRSLDRVATTVPLVASGLVTSR